MLGIKDNMKVEHVLPIAHTNANDTENMAQTSSDTPPPEPECYVCACFSGLTYKKFLHHVDVNKARTDPMLFQALQQKYFERKPLWKRILALRTLARVEYFEVSDP